MKQVNDCTVRRADPSSVASTRQTYTLAEVAGAYLPPEWTDGARWLSRRLNSGQLKGIKFGRSWVMRDSDIEYMLTKLSNDDKVTETESGSEPEAAAPTAISFAEALSPRSRAQLKPVAQR
jgi:hypothetical protein